MWLTNHDTVVTWALQALGRGRGNQGLSFSVEGYFLEVLTYIISPTFFWPITSHPARKAGNSVFIMHGHETSGKLVQERSTSTGNYCPVCFGECRGGKKNLRRGTVDILWQTKKTTTVKSLKTCKLLQFTFQNNKNLWTAQFYLICFILPWLC